MGLDNSLVLSESAINRDMVDRVEGTPTFGCLMEEFIILIPLFQPLDPRSLLPVDFLSREGIMKIRLGRQEGFSGKVRRSRVKKELAMQDFLFSSIDVLEKSFWASENWGSPSIWVS